MFIILGGDGKEYGPVTREQILAWVSEGRVNQTTQVKRQAEEQWQTLSQMPEFAAAAATIPTSYAASSSTPLIDMAQFEPADPISNDYEVDLGSSMTRGFNLLKLDYWPCVVATLLVVICVIFIHVPGMLVRFGAMLVQFASPAAGVTLSISGVLLQFLPQMLLGTVLQGGLWHYFFKFSRGERVDFKDAFMGFRKNCSSLMGCGILTTLVISIAFIVPSAIFGLVGFLIGLPFGGLGFGQEEPNWGPFFILIGLSVIGFLIALCVTYYFVVGYIFAPMLIVDRNMKAWQAMEYSRKTVHKHWFWIFAISFVIKLMAGLGVMGCYIGIFFTIPFYYAALVYVYHDIFYRRKMGQALSGQGILT